MAIWYGWILTGRNNKERQSQEGEPTITLTSGVTSGHCLILVYITRLLHREVITAPKERRGPWQSATIGCFRRDSGVNDRCGWFVAWVGLGGQRIFPSTLTYSFKDWTMAYTYMGAYVYVLSAHDCEHTRQCLSHSSPVSVARGKDGRRRSQMVAAVWVELMIYNCTGARAGPLYIIRGV